MYATLTYRRYTLPVPLSNLLDIPLFLNTRNTFALQIRVPKQYMKSTLLVVPCTFTGAVGWLT